MSRHVIYILSGLVTAFALVTGGALFFTRATNTGSPPATATAQEVPGRSNEAEAPAARVESPADPPLDEQPPAARHEEVERRERHPREREHEHHDEDDGDEAS